jgi:hypothetical protein
LQKGNNFFIPFLPRVDHPFDVGVQILIQKLTQKLTDSCNRSFFQLLLHVMVGVSILFKAIHHKSKSQFARFLEKAVLSVSTLASSLRRSSTVLNWLLLVIMIIIFKGSVGEPTIRHYRTAKL